MTFTFGFLLGAGFGFIAMVAMIGYLIALYHRRERQVNGDRLDDSQKLKIARNYLTAITDQGHLENARKIAAKALKRTE